MQQNRRQEPDSLDRLMERAGRIVSAYARGGSLGVPRSDGPAVGGGTRAADVPRADGPATGGRRRVLGEGGGGAVTVNVTLSGGPVFLDDERRIRALAKEIKRLIGEDRRRGLGVGG